MDYAIRTGRGPQCAGTRGILLAYHAWPQTLQSQLHCLKADCPEMAAPWVEIVLGCSWMLQGHNILVD